MNLCNTLASPLTTVKHVAQRASDYTCTCPDDVSNDWVCPIFASYFPSAAVGSFLGCNLSSNTTGILVGASAGAGVGATLTTCTLFACHGCECVKLKQRQITTSTQPGSLAGGQQQSTKLLLTSSSLGSGSENASCTAPVQSQPERLHPFLLSGDSIQSNPPVFFQPDIAGKKSTMGIALPVFSPGSLVNYV